MLVILIVIVLVIVIGIVVAVAVAVALVVVVVVRRLRACWALKKSGSRGAQPTPAGRVGEGRSTPTFANVLAKKKLWKEIVGVLLFIIIILQ